MAFLGLLKKIILKNYVSISLQVWTQLSDERHKNNRASSGVAEGEEAGAAVVVFC